MVKTLLDLIVPAMNFALLAAVGFSLTTDDFARVARQRALVLTGVLAPLVLLPPVALLLTKLFDTPPDITTGILLVAACPIGGISNAYSYMARASPALSVSLTGLSCLLAGLTIPLVSKGLELAIARPLGLEAPIGLLMTQLLLALGLPVLAGMIVRSRRPSLADRLGPPMQRVAFVGVTAVLILVVADDPRAFLNDLPLTVPLVAVFVVASACIGWLTASTLTSDRRDRFTIAAEFGARNVAVAIAIAVTLAGRTGFARFATTYALVEVPVMMAAVAIFRAGRAGEAGGAGLGAGKSGVKAREDASETRRA